MKHNLPYLINLPPFFIKDVDTSKLSGVKVFSLIIRGKILSFIVNKTDKKLFCFIINIFFKADGKIRFRDSKYIKVTNSGDEFSYPNKRILRVVKNIKSHLERLYSSYCLDEVNFSNGDVVIDCGANVGELNLAFKMKKIDIEYYAFEPDKETFECLTLNSSNKNIIYDKALSDIDGETQFYIDNEGGNSSIVNFGSEESINIATTRLDSVNLPADIKLLKLEAEGFEPEVLYGGLETLKKIQYISIDYGAERGPSQEMTIVECNKILYENNFKLVTFSEYRLIGLYLNSSL